VRELYEPVIGENFPYIGLGHIEQGSLALCGTGLSSETQSTKKVFRAGDILFGTLRPYFRKVVRPKFDGVCSTDITVIRAKEKRDRDFLFYFIANHPFIQYATSSSSGTRMPRAKWSHLSTIGWNIPTAEDRKKIAAILSAYDDLIENNLRRIKILEKMAQTLYREWFVKFRFPGHQKVKMVNSALGKIPEGWTSSTVGEACQSLVDGDWIETKDQGGKDFRLLQVSNVGVGEFIETGNYRYITQDTFKKLNCTEVLPGQILISRMPKPTGRAWLVTEMPWRMITAVDVAILSANKDALAPLLFVNILNSPEQLELVAKHSTGTTRERISRSALSKLPVMLPPLPLQEKFSAIAEPCYRQITFLQRKNNILRQTRDLLLPKLISGELDVSELDINIPEAKA